MRRKAVILFSSGIDSTTCVAIAKSQGFDCYLLSIHYGQKHSVEVENAKKLAKNLGAKAHQVFYLPLQEIGGSSLTDETQDVPDYQGKNEIPSTYVPARNTIFLSIALGFAEVLGAFDIFYGANDIDYSGYPDCRPEYVRAFETLANLAVKAGVEGNRITIHAPLLHLNKSEVIQKGIALGIDYSQTISCYRADAIGRACGKCDSCFHRQKGFRDAGIEDPTPYFLA